MNGQNRKAMEQALDALLSTLNVEGPAIFGAMTGLSYKGIDVPYHFAKVRKAIMALTNHGIEDRGN